MRYKKKKKTKDQYNYKSKIQRKKHNVINLNLWRKEINQIKELIKGTSRDWRIKYNNYILIKIQFIIFSL